MDRSIRLTGSELVFKLIDELLVVLERDDEKLFAKRLVDFYMYVEEYRPASMAVLNIIKQIAGYLIDHGVRGMNEYLNTLRESYDNALWRSAEVASRRVLDDEKIMTNSNSLAVRRLLKILHDQGKRIEVYTTESRPGREGFRLAEYSESLGFKTYLIVDSAARFFMKNIDKLFVGAEAIAANGAVVSKIGTSLLALIARESRRRVFVIAPSIKFSVESIYGELLRIPEGGIELLIDPEESSEIPEGYVARVPIYDVTPSDYIDGIATEYGLIAPQAISLLLRSIHGEYPPSMAQLVSLVNNIKEKYGVA
ncbi:MAG: initiation factor 2B [Desulfurococcaceae archaeon]